jgi:thioredoxin-related protein
MKRILLLLSLIIVSVSCTNAQKTDSVDKLKPLAPFRILTTDSVYATPASLKKGKPVMIVYFSPDCSHCQHMMYELKPKMALLNKIQVVMVTWSKDYDIRGIREFKRDFGLKNYPNFTIGTEGYTMAVQKYYDVKTTPYIAIYNSKGVFITSFNKPPKTEDILAAVKKVN